MRLALRALRSPRRILPRRGQRARVHIERRLEDMGIELPPVPKTQGVYQLCNQSGNLVYLAGHLPMPKGGELVKGKLGKDMSAEEGAEAARLCGLNAIATLKDYLGTFVCVFLSSLHVCVCMCVCMCVTFTCVDLTHLQRHFPPFTGDLDRVKRVVKVNGFVNSTPVCCAQNDENVEALPPPRPKRIEADVCNLQSVSQTGLHGPTKSAKRVLDAHGRRFRRKGRPFALSCGIRVAATRRRRRS